MSSPAPSGKPARSRPAWPDRALLAALAWYGVMLGFHGSRLDVVAWFQAVGLSLLVGTLLVGNALGQGRPTPLQVLRFYLIPFGVSSFTAATAPAGFIVIVSPRPRDNLMAAAVAGLVLLAACARARHRSSAAPEPKPEPMPPHA
ncbi:MAG: hypothetical protein ACFE0O_08245 [Opitutales bacterium]